MTNLTESRHDLATPRKDDHNTLQSIDSSPNIAALLLTNVATIASNEMNHSVLVKPTLFDPNRMALPSCSIVPGTMSCTCLHYDYGRSSTTTPPPSMVSSDDENYVPASPAGALCRPILPTSCQSFALVESSPPSSPQAKRQKTSHDCGNDDYLVQNPRVVRKVLTKKFSWKNYPEVRLLNESATMSACLALESLTLHSATI